jgi:hypothetical protein
MLRKSDFSSSLPTSLSGVQMYNDCGGLFFQKKFPLYLSLPSSLLWKVVVRLWDLINFIA